MDEEAIPLILENALYRESISEEDLKILKSKTKQKLEEDIKS